MKYEVDGTELLKKSNQALYMSAQLGGRNSHGLSKIVVLE